MVGFQQKPEVITLVTSTFDAASGSRAGPTKQPRLPDSQRCDNRDKTMDRPKHALPTVFRGFVPKRSHRGRLVVTRRDNVCHDPSGLPPCARLPGPDMLSSLRTNAQ